VTGQNEADLEKSNCTAVRSVSTAAGGDTFQVTSTCTITNNGPADADWEDSATISIPTTIGDVTGDCTANQSATQVDNGFLTSGSSTASAIVWDVQCTSPSNHTFVVNDVLVIDGTANTVDPIGTNNTDSASTVAMSITTQTTVSVTADGTTAPSAEDSGDTFQVEVDGTVNLGDAATGDVTMSLSEAGDCVLTPTGSQNQAVSTSCAVATATWNAVCTSASNHTFIGNIELDNVTIVNIHTSLGTSTPVDDSDSGGVTGITKHGEPDCGGANTPDATVTSTGATGVDIAFTFSCTSDGLQTTTTETIEADTCDVTGSAGAYNVQLASGTDCTYTLKVDIVAQASPHNIDDSPSDNSDSDQSLVCLDTDSDSIGDGGSPCNGPDNCPNTANTSQQDSDGDGEGDACDATPSHDVGLTAVVLLGPAAINLSDTNGRYLWVMGDLENFSAHTELVTISLDVSPNVPSDCTQVETQILPGLATFVMTSGEQLSAVWRVRYECHSPSPQIVAQTVTVDIVHDDIDGAGPHDGNDTNLANNDIVTAKSVIIQ
jgi:hypothetical protein